VPDAATTTGHPAHDPRRAGRKPSFDRDISRRRSVVERGVHRLKQWRGIAIRFEKWVANSRAMVVITSTMIGLAP